MSPLSGVTNTNNMIKKCFQWIKYKRIPLFAGILIGTTYIPFPPWALLFCYAPLWIWALQEQKLKEVFWGAWLTQFVLTLIGFHWITYTAHEFGQLPWVVSVAAMLLFAGLMHVYIPISVLLAKWIQKKWQLPNTATLFLFPLLLSLFERYWPSIFQWHLGYTLLWAKLPIYQLADLVGFEGLSAWILVFNAWVAYIWINQEQTKKALSHVAILFVIFCSLIVWGHNHKMKWSQTDAEVKINIIQANIGNLEKVYAEKGRGFQLEIVNKFLTLSNQSLQQFPDSEVLLWPETAVPENLDNAYLGGTYQTQLINGLRNMQKALITGAYSRGKNTHTGKNDTFNGLFIFDKNAQLSGEAYRKTELLAFGEYLPLSEQFPILLEWLPFVANFGRGPGPSIMSLPRTDSVVKIGGQICYEGLYSDFSRGLAQKGAEILVNVTNDSWFGKLFEPYQHLYMTLARAIETRRPLVRSTNTGISTAILADGQVLAQSPLHQEWFGQYLISYKKNPEMTFYVEYGHWDWLLILTAILLIVLTGIRNAKSKRS